MIPTQAGAVSLDSTIRAYLDGMRQSDRVIVMANGDPDGAVPLIREAGQEDPRVSVLVDRRRLGKGGALIAGLRYVAAFGLAPGPRLLRRCRRGYHTVRPRMAVHSGLRRRTHHRIEMARPLTAGGASTSPPPAGESTVQSPRQDHPEDRCGRYAVSGQGDEGLRPLQAGPSSQSVRPGVRHRPPLGRSRDRAGNP